MTGRPSLFTPELAKEICSRLSEGEPLAVICRDDHMPCDDTVRNWADGNEALARDIARARDSGHDMIAYRARAVARGDEGASTKDVARDRLVIETDLKLLAKWNPKKYGDKQAVELTGANGEPLNTGAGLEAAARLAAILEEARARRDEG